MRRADQIELGRYVRALADLLGLRDWTFELKWSPPDDENAFAEIHPTEGRKLAVVRFCDDFRDHPPAEQRHTVVHELLHCHHVAATDIVRLDACQQMSQAAYDVMFAGFKRQIEYMTDGLADAVAPHMPLIRWPATRTRKPAKTKKR